MPLRIPAYPRSCTLCAAVLVALVAMPAWVTEAQDTPESAPAPANTVDLQSESLADVEARANELVGAGQFAEAVPFLQDLVRRLDAVQDAQVQERLERVFLSLGYGLLLQGNAAEAATILERTVERYPNSTRMNETLKLLADAYRQVERWTDALEIYRKLAALPAGAADRTLIQLNMAEALMRSGKDEEGRTILQTIVTEKMDLETRSHALVLLLDHATQSGDAEQVSAVGAKLARERGFARFNLGLNVRLLQGAEKFLTEKKYETALLLLQLAVPSERLATELQQLVNGMEQQRPLLVKENPAGLPALNQRIQEIRVELEELAAAGSYTEELQLRIARTYYELDRRWEALWSFWSVYNNFPESDYAPGALFAAFSMAGALEDIEQARKLGALYLEKYPAGEHREEIEMGLAQVHMALDELPEAMTIFGRLQETMTEDRVDQVLYLLGFAQLQTDDFDAAQATFQKLQLEHPESSLRETAAYWLSFIELFKENYTGAEELFRAFVDRGTGGHLQEDATFRLASAIYAQGRYDEAKSVLEGFLKDYPATQLRAEAHTILGDIAGANGDLDEALAQYRMAQVSATSMVGINQAAFLAGRIYEAKDDWQGLYDHFQEHLKLHGDEGNPPDSTYRMGQALKEMGREEEMFELFADAVKRFGDERDSAGIDLLVEEYVYLLAEKQEGDVAAQVRTLLAGARQEGKRSLELRLLRMLDALNETTVMPDVTIADIEKASPAVLAWLGDQALKFGQTDFARQSLEALLERYPTEEASQIALLELAKMELESNPESAEAYLERLQEQFPGSPAAGEGIKMQGDFMAEREEHEKAIEYYQQVLAVKEWRGELWAEALYKIGRAHLATGEVKQAFAFFQRVYVMYGHYTEWTSRAYLQSAICLEKLNQTQDAIATYQEMLAIEALRSTDAFKEAQQRLAKLNAGT